MACNDTHKCLLAPVLHDLRLNADEDHEAAELPKWMELHDEILEEGGSLASD